MLTLNVCMFICTCAVTVFFDGTGECGILTLKMSIMENALCFVMERRMEVAMQNKLTNQEGILNERFEVTCNK